MLTLAWLFILFSLKWFRTLLFKVFEKSFWLVRENLGLFIYGEQWLF